MAIDLGTAYVQIVPSASGIGSKLAKELDAEAEPAAEESGKKSGEKYSSGFGSAIKTGLVAAAKIGFAAVTAAAAGIAALGTESVKLYSEFEQLQGGTELLFGEAYQTVMDYASNAYKNVQMSTNDYLTQVNGLSTGLKTALGGDAAAAAELANKVVVAEADVVAATGASQEAVQNAFNGIMKSNYTMLDNLQLGITPTKEGMESLIATVNEWNAANGNATEYTIDNLADCQSALVDYIAMQGLAGYASMEASETIQGSVSSMKGAWTDFLTGMSNSGADMSKLTENLITSAESVLNNILPIVEQMLPTLINSISNLASAIIPRLNSLVSELLPVIISGATNLVQQAVAILPSLIETAVNALPSLASAAVSIVTSLGQGIITAIPQLVSAVSGLVTSFGEYLASNSGNLAQGAVSMIQTIGETLMNSMDTISTAAIGLIQNLASGIAENLPTLIESGLTMLTSLTGSFHDNLGLIVDAAMDLAMSLAQGLADSLPTIIEQVPLIVSNIANCINDNAPKILETGIQIVITLIGGLIQAIPTLVANIPQIITAIVDVIMAFNWVNLGKNIMEFFKNGITSMIESVKGAGKNVLDGITNTVKSLPSNLMNIAKSAMNSLSGTIKGLANSAVSAMKAVGSGILSALSHLPAQMLSIGQNLIKGLWNGISNMTGWILNLIGGFAKSVISKIKGLFGIHSPSTVFAEIGGYLAEGLGVGWQDEYSAVNDALIESVQGTTDAVSAEIDKATQMAAQGVNGALDVNYTSSAESSLLTAVNALGERFSNMQVVLSTGDLVGGIATEMDRQQGKIASRRARMA